MIMVLFSPVGGVTHQKNIQNGLNCLKIQTVFKLHLTLHGEKIGNRFIFLKGTLHCLMNGSNNMDLIDSSKYVNCMSLVIDFRC